MHVKLTETSKYEFLQFVKLTKLTNDAQELVIIIISSSSIIIIIIIIIIDWRILGRTSQAFMSVT